MATKLYEFIREQRFIHGRDVDPKHQTHILQPHGSKYNIQLELKTQEQFTALYTYAKQAGNFTIMCNPGMNICRKLFIDIDGYKPDKGIELTEKQIIFVQYLFCYYAKHMFGATKFMVTNKPNVGGNIHITSNAAIADVWYQRYFIHKIKEIVKYMIGERSNMLMDEADTDFILKHINEFDGDELSAIYKALDDAPGIRAIYSAKDGKPLDYYKVCTAADVIPDCNTYVSHCLNADPSYTCSLTLADCNILLDAAVMVYKDYRLECRGAFMTHDRYMADGAGELESLDDVLATIVAIPDCFVAGKSWRKTLMRIKSQLSGADDERNTQIIDAFDYLSQCVVAEYDAESNRLLYETADVEIGGYHKLLKDIAEYNESPVVDFIKTRITSAMTLGRTRLEDEVEGVETINTDYIDVDFAAINAKTIILKSATGTGKTTNLINFINNNKSARILYVGCRKSLLRSLKDVKCDDGTAMFDYYETLDWKAARNDGAYGRILIQMESISRLSAAMIDDMDYIFMDEYNSIIEQLSSPNYIDPYNAMNILMCIFNAAAKICIMDGYISREYINLLDHVRPAATFNRRIIDNIKQNKTDEKMIMVSKMADMDELILTAVNNDKKFVVAADSKATCKRIAKLIEIRNAELVRNKRIFMVNGDTSMLDATVRVMENINEEIVKYDYFIYSPSITAGVDVDVSHFDTQFNIFTTNVVSGTANLQMINRVRHKWDNISYTFINKRRQIKKTADWFMAEYRSRTYHIEPNELLRLSFVPCGSYNLICDNPMLRIITESKVIKENGNNVAIAQFVQHLINQGYAIELYERRDETAFEMPATLTSAVINSAIKKEEATNVAIAEAKSHKKEVCVSAAMQHERHKHIIKTVYKVEDSAITADFVEKYGGYKAIQAFNQRVVLYSATNSEAYVRSAMEKDLLTTEYSPELFNKEVFSNRRVNKHYIIGAYVLSRALAVGDFKNIIKNQIVITRAKLIENINNNFDDDLDLSEIVALFKCRVNIKNCNTMKELANENPRSLLNLINVIIGGLYDIKLATVNTKRDKYTIKIGGYIPDSYDRFVN